MTITIPHHQMGSAIDITSYQSIYGSGGSLKKRRTAKHKSTKAIVATGSRSVFRRQLVTISNTFAVTINRQFSCAFKKDPLFL